MANKFVNRQFNLNTTNAVSVYTCPAENVAMIKSVQVLNVSSGSVIVTASITDNSASATFNFSRRNMATGKTSDLLTGVKVFEENDSLNITAAHSNMITGVVAILEQDRT
tara:strand:- start:322 stop:651 length:330 start_codon:yes stop_codon:yes gene_type:complete